MKKATIYAATVLLGAFGTVFGQTTSQDLDHAVQTAENLQQDIATAGNAIDQLAKELTILGNPDAVAFHDQLYVLVNSVQNNADDVDYFVSLAKDESPVDFSTTAITAQTTELVVLNDDLMADINAITDAVNDNRNQDAIDRIPHLRSVMASQSATADAIIALLGDIKANTAVYEVVIHLVDAQGNQVFYSDLHGYYAYDQATSEYLYPQNQEGDTFVLSAGTYMFDSFNGYFSGTGSTTVTLSDNLVNEDGVIVVELVYWSE